MQELESMFQGKVWLKGLKNVRALIPPCRGIVITCGVIEIGTATKNDILDK